jgi:phage protein D
MELALLVDVSSQATACTVSGWDPSGKEMVSYKADDAALGSELNGFKSGGSILKQSFGKRDQQIVHQLPVTSQEAQALAEGAFRRAARRFVTGKGITECDARVRVGATVQLSELGNPFNGKYYVARVRHTFDQMEGSKTAFWVERAGIGQG